MNSAPERLSELVLRRANRDDMGKFAVDSQMLAVWMALDGQTTLGSVAQELNLPLAAVGQAVNALARLGLVERGQEVLPSVLNQEFLDFLYEQFSLAVGPIARLLIEEEALDLGHSISKFPAPRVAELIDTLAKEIRREEKSTLFKQRMIAKIREMGF
jgi:hypothetical protein